MIIDDDPDILSILQDVFNEEGYQVVTYPDKRSVKGVIINRPDLVLIDNRLKYGWGHELCSEIKANERTRHIPVILMSAAPDVAEFAESCGADHFLNKPFELNQLLSTVQYFLNR